MNVTKHLGMNSKYVGFESYDMSVIIGQETQ